jgi:two-component system response regulator RegX3
MCRQIRRLTDVPIIMLTALDQPEDIVRGLEAGADDYVTKPFRSEVLIARAVAVLRRAELADTVDRPASYHDEHLTVDLDGHLVMIKGQPVHLSAKEYGVLSYLVQHAGRVRTFAQILDRVWGQGYGDSTQYLHVYVSRLRKKLEPDPGDPVYLISEHGFGYRFAPAAMNHL